MVRELETTSCDVEAIFETARLVVVAPVKSAFVAVRIEAKSEVEVAFVVVLFAKVAFWNVD